MQSKRSSGDVDTLRINWLSVGNKNVPYEDVLNTFNNKERDMTYSPFCWFSRAYRQEFAGKQYTLTLDSIRGSEDNLYYKKQFYAKNDIFLLFFSFNDADSLADLEQWYEEIKQCNENAKCYLIGLRSDDNEVISREQVAEMGNKLKLPHFECPASYGFNDVSNLFKAISSLAASQSWQNNAEESADRKRCLVM